MAKTERTTLLEAFDPKALLEQTRKVAAWSIDLSEKTARRALDIQEQATSWAKDTPLARLFETQRSVAEKVIENSATLARNFWRVEKPEST